VFAVGVVLYEMLTGERPFRGSTPAVVLQQIVHEQPRSLRSLNQAVPRDLETITLKCLHKQPSRRYADAGELADDLDRLLKGEPIHARPLRWWERTSLWVRRHPVAATVLLLVGLALAGLIGEGLWYNAQLRQERDQANTNFEVALQNNIEVEGLIQRLKPLAGTRAADIVPIVNQALDNYNRMMERIGPLPAVRAGKAKLLTTASDVYLEVGKTRLALDTAEQATVINRQLTLEEPENQEWKVQLGQSLGRLGAAVRLRGDSGKALTLFRESLALRKQLVDADPDNLSRRQDLATGHESLALTLAVRGDWKRSEDHYREAAHLREDIAKRGGVDPLWQSRWVDAQVKTADLLRQRGALAEARSLCERALATSEQLVSAHRDNVELHKPHLAVLVEMGQIRQSQNDRSGAEEHFNRARAVARCFASLDPENIHWPAQVLMVDMTQASSLIDVNFATALIQMKAIANKQLPLAEEQANRDRENMMWQMNLASCHLARWDFATAVTILEEVLAKDPDNAAVIVSLPLATRLQSIEERRRIVKLCNVFFERKAKDDVNHAPWMKGLGDARFVLGEIEFESKNYAAAVTAFRESKDYYRRLMLSDPNDPRWLTQRLRAVSSAHKVLELQGKKAEAELERRELEELKALQSKKSS
jgi:tetratricopeptide (TPR) repeat protein